MKTMKITELRDEYPNEQLIGLFNSLKHIEAEFNIHEYEYGQELDISSPSVFAVLAGAIEISQCKFVDLDARFRTVGTITKPIKILREGKLFGVFGAADSILGHKQLFVNAEEWKAFSGVQSYIYTGRPLRPDDGEGIKDEKEKQDKVVALLGHAANPCLQEYDESRYVPENVIPRNHGFNEKLIVLEIDVAHHKSIKELILQNAWRESDEYRSGLNSYNKPFFDGIAESIRLRVYNQINRKKKESRGYQSLDSAKIHQNCKGIETAVLMTLLNLSLNQIAYKKISSKDNQRLYVLTEVDFSKGQSFCYPLDFKNYYFYEVFKGKSQQFERVTALEQYKYYRMYANEVCQVTKELLLEKEHGMFFSDVELSVVGFDPNEQDCSKSDRVEFSFMLVMKKQAQ